MRTMQNLFASVLSKDFGCFLGSGSCSVVDDESAVQPSGARNQPPAAGPRRSRSTLLQWSATTVPFASLETHGFCIRFF